MEYSVKLKKLVDTWIDLATTKNLSSKGTQKQIMTFNIYQNIDLIRYSLVRQAILDEVIKEEDFSFNLWTVEGQLQIVVEVVFLVQGGDIY